MSKKLSYFLLIVGFFGLSTMNLSEVEASKLNFSVETVIPDNQVDKNKTYYDLRIEPNKKQNLKMIVNNSTDKDVMVEITAEAATTNTNGVVEYGVTKSKRDSTLENSIGDIVTISEKEPVIPAKSSKEIILTVNAPEEEFEGILAGGITIKEKESAKNTDKDSQKGMAIENRYSYVVAFILHGREEQVSSELKLNTVKPDQINVRNIISANVQNTKSKYMNQVTIDAKVTRKNNKKVLYSEKKDKMQIAPNSNFNFPISLNGEALEAGKYTLTMAVDSQGETWNFKKDFTIEKAVANKLNKEDVSIVKDYTQLYLLIGGILILLVFILFFAIMHKRKKEKQKLERELKRLKSQKKRKRKKTTAKL